MARVGIHDYEAVLSFLEEAHAVEGPEPFTPELLDRLAQLADCQSASFFEVDWGRRVFTGYIPCTAEGGEPIEPEETWWTCRRTREWRRYKVLNGPGPIVLSDAFTARQRTDPDFSINFRDQGFRDQIHVSLDPTRNWDAEVALFHERDLGQRERLIMKILHPHLAAMYRSAKIRRRVEQASEERDGEAMATLTPRERSVIDCVAEGFTNREIAETLVVAPSTVRKHLENIYEKLGVRSRTAALAKMRDLTPRVDA